ncbi:MAG TPA: hypothetical protein VKT49_21515 [Bryobacteraceae bacterium]|nr:hypothetical protein [Bryobacteraceae bacterium]
MIHRHLLRISLPAALVLCGVLSVSAQAPSKAAPGAKWSVPRTPEGHPDLEGVWDAASMTPLERPAELGDKEFYTPEEIAAYEKKRGQDLNRDRRDGSAEADLGRAYNEAWFDRGAHLASDHRTSRLVDPPNGRFPAMTPAAAKKYKDVHAWLAEHANDGPETRALPDRCLVFSQSGPPFLPGNYNNYYQIVQSPGSIAILSEMAHQARTIPVVDADAGTPRLPQNVRQWQGHSAAHWEGDTLVIESTNFRASDQSRFGVQYDGMSDENLRVIEHLTRTGPHTITYRATVIDPTVYTQPWTVEFPLERTDSPVLEYACHEGNYAMTGILSGARAEEKRP